MNGNAVYLSSILGGAHRWGRRTTLLGAKLNNALALARRVEHKDVFHNGPAVC